MKTCRNCTSEISDQGRFCSTCGLPVDHSSSQAPTHVGGQVVKMPVAVEPTAAGAAVAARLLSSDPSDAPRFTAGSMLGNRYRIVGLLGRGGMGEVYRADDLTLGQPVALKLLPENLTHDKARLQRLLGEVRIARQVSHPSVCRVYDIGEVDNLHYFSMEFVDGEDLRSLLLRIGKFSNDKAVEISRQICAGLAAAHERGVIHRDLKPANIMIDGRGKVRITDFGLAASTGQISGAEVRAGTPAYMSPEQLRGDEVTVRSDIYSLGLVLYELFTGEPVSGGGPSRVSKTTDVISTMTSTTTQDSVVDPAVERVILRCLEENPADRPASAIAVAAALPGGDPLAAALAAGEIPSPEMVAAAGEEGSLSPKVAAGLLATILAGLFFILILFDRSSLVGHVPLPKSTEVLADNARNIIQRLGYEIPPVDFEYGFHVDAEFLEYIEDNDKALDRWDRLATNRHTAISFWYRQSPRHLIAKPAFTNIDIDDPPMKTQGEIRLSLDTSGQLLKFEAIPPVMDSSEGPWEEPAWSEMFTLAGLDSEAFASVPPLWTPEMGTDSRLAWEAENADWPGQKLRVEAASFHGAPVLFSLLAPWDKPEEVFKAAATPEDRVTQIFYFTFAFLPLSVGIFLAQRNLRLGRGDAQGAFKLAMGFLILHTVVWALWASHVPSIVDEWNIFQADVGYNLFLAASVWVAYVALEPYLRRYWPDTLISWSRVLTGRYRDPLVGRDLLIGGVAGVLMALVLVLGAYLPGLFGMPASAPSIFNTHALRGLNWTLGSILDSPIHGLFYSMMSLFVLFLVKLVVRKVWIAATLVTALISLPIALTVKEHWLVVAAMGMLVGGILVVALLRHGIVSATVAMSVFQLTVISPLTTDLSAWYVRPGFIVLGACASLGIFGFKIALAGRPILAPSNTRPETV